MKEMFLVKYGELALKGKNRYRFIAKLIDNISLGMKGLPVSISSRPGRIYIRVDQNYKDELSRVLERTFGIVSFARSYKCDKHIDSIEKKALELTQELLHMHCGTRFKIETRRTDKSFPLSSYEISCRLGELLRNSFKELKVDVNEPEWILSVEIRESAYIYGPSVPGLKGLPVGCNGTGLVLLSGGIDSPVAAYLIAKRGVALDAVYFHTHPFTSARAKEKVILLSETLRKFIPGFRLFVVDFSDVQIAVKERAFHKAVTLMSRASMMRIAEIIALENNHVCLVTGESLGQVASQTPESMRFTSSHVSLPVFRPLIGMDKEEIVEKAKKIATYEISVLPYDDCCTLFAPESPIIKPDFKRIRSDYENLELDELIKEASRKVEIRGGRVLTGL